MCRLERKEGNKKKKIRGDSKLLRAGKNKMERSGTYCGNELVDTVGGHAVEVREVELQVDLVVEHVLAQRAS